MQSGCSGPQLTAVSKNDAGMAGLNDLNAVFGKPSEMKRGLSSSSLLRRKLSAMEILRRCHSSPDGDGHFSRALDPAPREVAGAAGRFRLHPYAGLIPDCL